MLALTYVGTKNTPEDVALALAARGAIMTLIGKPSQYFLVGDFAWIDRRRIFWFVAHGDTEADGRVIEFDEAQVLSRDRVGFVRNRTTFAYLVSIDLADVDDPDDYRVAWGIWQQVAPARADQISRLRAKHAQAQDRFVGDGT